MNQDNTFNAVKLMRMLENNRYGHKDKMKVAVKYNSRLTNEVNSTTEKLL